MSAISSTTTTSPTISTPALIQRNGNFGLNEATNDFITKVKNLNKACRWPIYQLNLREKELNDMQNSNQVRLAQISGCPSNELAEINKLKQEKEKCINNFTKLFPNNVTIAMDNFVKVISTVDPDIDSFLLDKIEKEALPTVAGISELLNKNEIPETDQIRAFKGKVTDFTQIVSAELTTIRQKQSNAPQKTQQ